MQFNLQSFKAEKIELEILPKLDIQSEAKKTFNLNYHILLHKELKNYFCVVFNLDLIHEGEFKISIKYSAWFLTSEDFNEEFLKSEFAQVNAPAIAYPFLRSFISNLTLNAGYHPVILPTVNFVKLYEDKKNK